MPVIFKDAHLEGSAHLTGSMVCHVKTISFRWNDGSKQPGKFNQIKFMLKKKFSLTTTG